MTSENPDNVSAEPEATTNAKVPNEYGADAIQVLEGLEAVRKRPGMYIGSTGERGLHHLVQEIVDNSVDEALAGYCDLIDVTILSDGAVRVIDNGRGIPVDMHRTEGKSTVEGVQFRLRSGLLAQGESVLQKPIPQQQTGKNQTGQPVQTQHGHIQCHRLRKPMIIK